MKSVTFTKELFRCMLDLSQRQPWIIDKYEKLEVLMFNDCSDQEQQELVFELINKFEYLSHERYVECINSLGQEIYTEPGISDDNTQIVAMAADSGADSSQYVINDLKFIMDDLGWRKHILVNTFGKAYNAYKKSNSHMNIILVDEFVGSGQTVANRVAAISRVFGENNVNGYTVKVKVLVSTEHALKKLIDEGIDISAQIIIKKGITDNNSEVIAKKKINTMLQLESLLKESINGKDLPSLGYGQSESLYYRDRGNVPNNVFPIFWWPIYKDDKIRKVLLTRAMGDL